MLYNYPRINTPRNENRLQYFVFAVSKLSSIGIILAKVLISRLLFAVEHHAVCSLVNRVYFIHRYR